MNEVKLSDNSLKKCQLLLLLSLLSSLLWFKSGLIFRNNKHENETDICFYFLLVVFILFDWLIKFLLIINLIDLIIN